ncbi:hypothetical protein LXL04_006414 [Taraxacum kok-saghyz]
MMFSTNPFAQFASSLHVFPPPNSFLENEKEDLYINHHHNHHTTTTPFVSGDSCLLPYSPSFTTSKQDSGGINEGLGLEQVSPRKKKKDHHSKIHTAQGPRDRRVRLSIDVARKFFFLQDLLGFDKASKTLDWLFNKSKIPIDELIQEKKQSSSPSVTDESEVLFLKESDEEDKGQKKKSASKCSNRKRKNVPRKHKSEVPVNQSRAEARARARERTKEKLNNKKLDNESNKIHGDFISIINRALFENFERKAGEVNWV